LRSGPEGRDEAISRLRVTLCQSAEFRPTGGLYDTVGITPDILVEARPEDRFGGSDAVLEAALKRLRLQLP